MDAKLFVSMLSDKKIFDLKRMQYKYSVSEVAEFIDLLRCTMYTFLPLKDFDGKKLVYLDNFVRLGMSSVKLLLTPQSGSESYGLKAMEDEIHSTFRIENIESSRVSIRKILEGYAPSDENECRIYGIKQGLEFIADKDNKITEVNLHKLYNLVVDKWLDDENRLLPTRHYRHDDVFIVGGATKHEGLPHNKLPEYMENLIKFINEDFPMNDLLKAALIHFYIGYLHPWFDGNGRTARLLHIWYLVQQGYPSAMFVPLSRYIDDSRAQYYKAYTMIEENVKISGLIDVTPFLVYFIESVYNKLEALQPDVLTMEVFQKSLRDGNITEREKDLWNFVISAYGNREFSTKQLERDFAGAAYATIRGFVLKFVSLGLLNVQKYGNKAKYKVNF